VQPDYLRGRLPLTDVEQLRHETLLSIDDDRPGLMRWPLWFAELGIKGYSTRRHPKINSHPLLMQAACERQGIALGWALRCDDLLRRGELMRPLGATVWTARAFHCVGRRRGRWPGGSWSTWRPPPRSAPAMPGSRCGRGGPRTSRARCRSSRPTSPRSPWTFTGPLRSNGDVTGRLQAHGHIESWHSAIQGDNWPSLCTFLPRRTYPAPWSVA
jgi:LysR substrate binding domain